MHVPLLCRIAQSKQGDNCSMHVMFFLHLLKAVLKVETKPEEASGFDHLCAPASMFSYYTKADKT